MAFQNNFYNPNVMQQNPYNYNMYQPQMSQQAQAQIQMQQPQIQNFRQPIGLPGKIVDSLEAVKAADIPLDGSISYFVLANGEAIATKQLMQDGTSKTTVYKPIDLKEEIKKEPKYVTLDELETKIKDLNSNNVKDDIKTIKKQIKDIMKEIDSINEERED